MISRWLPQFCTVCMLGVSGATSAQTVAEEDDSEPLDEITVVDRRVANTRPAGTYASVATLLRFDPSTELQSRGLPEGQADVTVQGGLFENTGFKLSAVTVIDPQTGHYAAELPIDPAMLSAPEIQTGIDNSLGGFNSNVATISYGLPPISQGGSVLLGAGSDDLNFQSLRLGLVSSRNEKSDLGMQLSASRSEGDGSIQYGDHEFKRFNAQVQRADDDSQSDLIFAYQDKFYGWPGAYTGFASLPETDHTKTTLLLANHRKQSGSGWWEASAFYRELEDDYDFDRRTQESGELGSFDHETRVFGAGLHGQVVRGNWDWNYSAQVTADELVYSTDLTEGTFNSRDYISLSVVPSIELGRTGDRSVVLRAGLTADISNRDENALLPVLGVTFARDTASGSSQISLDYAGTSQVPGYTVLKSRPTGLFGGNPDLGREYADQLTFTYRRESSDWHTTVLAFYRQDDDLVDWTYSIGAPFARQANSVDIDVLGAQILFGKSWQAVDLVAGYTYLDKDADYLSDTVDASFYALNFAKHRATLALRIRFLDSFELRLDNEYRQQEDNPLRGSSDSAFITSAALAWQPQGSRGFGMALTADNLTDDDYEQFPGTPAVGQQVSFSVRYDW